MTEDPFDIGYEKGFEDARKHFRKKLKLLIKNFELCKDDWGMGYFDALKDVRSLMKSEW
jgi:hypothetical protein